MSKDLFNKDTLRKWISEIGGNGKIPVSAQEWIEALAHTIAVVRGAGRIERASYEFQEMLWERNGVADVGQGNVSVGSAINDANFRDWLAERSMSPLPESSSERIDFLATLVEDIKAQLKEFVPSRMPQLKIFRVLAALYPEAMTTIADEGKLRKLAQLFTFERNLPAAGLHVRLFRRICG